MPEVSIVVPVYNEADNLGPLVSAIDKYVKGISYEVIVVDDGSYDGTLGVVKVLSRKYNIKFLERGKKLGLASAVVDGLRIARGKYVCVMDGDLQHHPKYIPAMYKKLVKNPGSLVIGSRFVEDFGNEQRLDSKLGTFICRSVFGIKVKDPLTGFFMLERKKFTALVPKLNLIGYKILLELIVKGRFEKVFEIPIVFDARRRGQSKLDLKTRLEFIKQVVGLILWKARN